MFCPFDDRAQPPRAHPGSRVTVPAVPMASVIVVAVLVAASTLLAHAADEIQVYNAEIAEVGQWTLQQHLNYAINGRKQPDYLGGLIPNHALQGTPELAYGISDWWEIGFYAPFAVTQNGHYLSDAGKVRQLFALPDAAKKEFFYGINFELSYETQAFSPTRWNMEIRPIVGWRKNDYELIINPIVDLGWGDDGTVDFAPCARFARKISDKLSVGVEYYTELGPLENWHPFNQQQHNIYAVVDFKIGRFDVNAGIGYGLTPASDRLVAKMIIGTDLTESKSSDKSSDKSSASSRALQRFDSRLSSAMRPWFAAAGM